MFSSTEAPTQNHLRVKQREPPGNVGKPRRSKLGRKVTACLIGINQLAAPVERWRHRLKTNGIDPKRGGHAALRGALLFPPPPQKKEQQPCRDSWVKNKTLDVEERIRTNQKRKKKKKAALVRFSLFFFFLQKRNNQNKKTAPALLHYSLSFFTLAAIALNYRTNLSAEKSLRRRKKKESKIHQKQLSGRRKRRSRRRRTKSSNWNQHLRKVVACKAIISSDCLTCSTVFDNRNKSCCRVRIPPFFFLLRAENRKSEASLTRRISASFLLQVNTSQCNEMFRMRRNRKFTWLAVDAHKITVIIKKFKVNTFNVQSIEFHGLWPKNHLSVTVLFKGDLLNSSFSYLNPSVCSL